MATQLKVNDEVVAVRFWTGTRTVVQMHVTKSQWQGVKDLPADVGAAAWRPGLTAQDVLDDWVSNGAEQVWKTAADWREEARRMRAHRHAKLLSHLADRADRNAAELEGAS